MTKKHTLELRGDREIVFTRPFAAPCELVWEAYTDCKHLVHWWGPAGWDLTHCELDLRVGGTWHYCMAGPFNGEHMESWGLGTYLELDAPQRLVYEDAFSDKDANVDADFPSTLNTITFEAVDGGTLMRISTVCASAEARQQLLDMDVEQGVAETWYRLDDHLPTIG